MTPPPIWKEKTFRRDVPPHLPSPREPRAGMESYGVKIIIDLKEFSQNVSFRALRWVIAWQDF